MDDQAMNDHLSRALRSLPRVRSRPGFTDRVLRRLDEAERRTTSIRAWRRTAAAAVGAACLLALAAGARQWWFHQQQQLGFARLATMESERQALLVELESLQHQMADARPFVYLGGSNDIDLVLDLDRLRRSEFRLPGLSRGSSPTPRAPAERAPIETAPIERALIERARGGQALDVRPASYNPTIY